ncbi:MAG: arginine--tRNA ligase [Candidatus Saccharibacteria bacterium]|nr:arginine--tRNA ligase [Candidatus Saccharibacteria bacterium]
MNDIKLAIESSVKDLFDQEVSVELNMPEPQFGDFSSNVALQLSKKLGKKPREIAEELTQKLVENDSIEKVEVAGPGFINITLKNDALSKLINQKPVDSLSGQSWVVEYSCPNYFKELHTGHLYQTILGDVIARLAERAGAIVHRTNFGGDVGLHVAKFIYGVLQQHGDESAKLLDDIDKSQRPTFISDFYVSGSKQYEYEQQAKTATDQINRLVYKIAREGDSIKHETILLEGSISVGSDTICKLYFTCRQWSKDYFVDFYKQIRVDEFEKYYPESSTEELGLQTVNEYLEKGVFAKSQDATVFKGEDFGLHTRVFITGEGLPTYEAKDLGLVLMEKSDYDFKHRVLITGSDQREYMKVVWKALDQIQPGIEATMTHITNGIINFGDGQKMSSRLGNVTRAVDVLSSVKEKVQSTGDSEVDTQVTLGAIKYEFLKHRVGGDIAFDVNESVSISGNSGPYLQYAHARGRSILEKSTKTASDKIGNNLNDSERLLVRKLTEYIEVIENATRELAPHHICTYLYELSQEFNRFYEKNHVIGSDEEANRLRLVSDYVDILKQGLNVLGIEAPERV